MTDRAWEAIRPPARCAGSTSLEVRRAGNRSPCSALLFRELPLRFRRQSLGLGAQVGHELGQRRAGLVDPLQHRRRRLGRGFAGLLSILLGLLPDLGGTLLGAVDYRANVLGDDRARAVRGLGDLNDVSVLLVSHSTPYSGRESTVTDGSDRRPSSLQAAAVKRKRVPARAR